MLPSHSVSYPTLLFTTLSSYIKSYPTPYYPTIPHHTLLFTTLPSYTKSYPTPYYHTIPYHTLLHTTVSSCTKSYLTPYYHTIPYPILLYSLIPYIPTLSCSQNMIRIMRTWLSTTQWKILMCESNRIVESTLHDGAESCFLVRFRNLGSVRWNLPKVESFCDASVNRKEVRRR